MLEAMSSESDSFSKIFGPLPGLSLLFLGASMAHGQITYVDADPSSNTTLADGSALQDETHYSSTLNDADGLWNLRSFANESTIFASNDSGAEDCPRLRTTVAGLEAGTTYNVYVYFWGATGANWRLRAGLENLAGELDGYNSAHTTTSSFATSSYLTDNVGGSNLNPGPLTTATDSDPAIENGGYFSGSVETAEGNRSLYQVLLGQVTSTDGTLSVYVDDLANQSSVNRTWFDGVGYQAVSEPSLTYLDADPELNTTLADGTEMNLTASPSNPEDYDSDASSATLPSNWKLRTGFANDSTVLAAAPAADAPVLRTALSGLTPGAIYEVNAHYWAVDTSQNWRFAAGLQADSLSTGGAQLGGENLAGFDSTLLFINAPVLLSEDNRSFYQLNLGYTRADSSGQIFAYIDDVPGDGQRTWYDGLSYAETNLDGTADNDGDNLTNNDEVDIHQTNPLLADTDGDGLNDDVEIFTHQTNPLLADSDGDGLSDSFEVANQTDPNDSNDPMPVAPQITVAPDGVWSWFSEERAIWHLGKLYTGYVLSDGRYGITQYDPATGTSSESIVSTAASQEQDDHNDPVITVLPDNRLLAVYAKHNTNTLFYSRTSLVTEPASLQDWGPEQSFNPAGSNPVTYANVFRLSEESDRIYNFFRCIQFNPTLSYSDNNGTSWSEGIHFIDTGTGGSRPYPKYTSKDGSRIDLIYTDGHPRNENNSIYHLFFEDGDFNQSDGTLLKTFADLAAGDPIDHDGDQADTTGPERGTVVYQYRNEPYANGEDQDDYLPGGRGWTWDITYQPNGNPVCAFQVKVFNVTGTSGFRDDRIYYYYATWDGSQWNKKLIAQGGRPLYSAERSYGGGMSIDPENPNVVYISSNHEAPADLDLNNANLNSTERYEIYRGITNDGGETFSWEAITANSHEDNLRPIVAENHDYDRHALWFQGSYNTYTDYDTAVVGIFENTAQAGLEILKTGFSADNFFIDVKDGTAGRIVTSSNDLDLPFEEVSGVSTTNDESGNPTRFLIPAASRESESDFFRIEESSN